MPGGRRRPPGRRRRQGRDGPPARCAWPWSNACGPSSPWRGSAPPRTWDWAPGGRPYCPSCGAPPSIAILRKGGEDDGFLTNHGGQRWLHCSRCATEWRFKRHACPHCGSEEGKDLKYYQPERHNGERADVCGACGRYLLAVDVRELVEEPEPDVAALGLIPLDMAMQRQGYEPLAPTTWNRFDP